MDLCIYTHSVSMVLWDFRVALALYSFIERKDDSHLSCHSLCKPKVLLYSSASADFDTMFPQVRQKELQDRLSKMVGV